jgi:HEAT repeat protein
MRFASRILGVLPLLGVMSAAGAAYDANPSDAEDRAVESTIAQLHSMSKHERRSAVDRLANTRSERATEGLIAALDDSSVSEAAVAALAQRAQQRSLSRRAIEGLIHALDNRKARVRESAVHGLADVDTQRSTEGLIHALDGADAETEQTAVTALARRARGSMSEERAVEGLIHALDSDESDVRRQAVDGLRAVDSERARQGLEKAAAASAR